MECDKAIFALESDLLFARIQTWILDSVGEEHTLFLKCSHQPERQKYLLDTFFLFICAGVVASDLSSQTLERIDTIRSLLARCSYMTEVITNNNTPQDDTQLLKLSANNNDIQKTQLLKLSANNNDVQKYIGAFRTRLRSLLRLFQLLSSTDYVVKLLNEDKILKLGALTLHLWGESLLSFAETSLRYWKPQRLECLKVAEDRLLKCMALSTNRHQSAFLLGNAFLLHAKSDAQSPVYKSLLEKAYKSYSFSTQLLSFPDYLSALARVCVLLDRESECQQWLRMWVSSHATDPLVVLDDIDFDKYRAKKWFYDVADSVVPKTASQLYAVPSSSAFDEKKYNMLQNSLLESGFSMKKLLELINWLPISSGQSQIRADDGNEYTRKQKERLQQRLELYQLKPKREIPGDGNCQMHAISDQLYDTISKSADIRKMVVDWLQKNRDWQLPNGAIFHQFVHDRKWEDYCAAMAKDGCWGDHLTLLAISEMFGAQISIFSSVEGDNFITEIHPTTKKLNKVLLLSHYAEFHYGSLEHITGTPSLA